jgi:hypothetical protein
VRVTFARGVSNDVAELTSSSDPSPSVESIALRRQIAQLLLDCERNPYVGEMMGEGKHPELAHCRRVRFDLPDRRGRPRYRLIYRNEPDDGAPAECRWLALGPRGGLVAHRRAAQRT